MTWGAEQNGSSTKVDVGSDLVYAVPQHEELTWEHPRGGQAKYLEEPLNTHGQKFIFAGLKDALKEVL